MSNETRVTSSWTLSRPRRGARSLLVLLALAMVFASAPGCATTTGPRPAVVGEQGGVDPVSRGGYSIRSGLSRLLSWAPHAGQEGAAGLAARTSAPLAPKAGLAETGCMGFGGLNDGEAAVLIFAGIVLAPVWIPIVLLSLLVPA